MAVGEKESRGRGISAAASCAHVPTRLFTHSLTHVVVNHHKSPKPNIREGRKEGRRGDRIRVGGADAAARYEDRR